MPFFPGLRPEALELEEFEVTELLVCRSGDLPPLPLSPMPARLPKMTSPLDKRTTALARRALPATSLFAATLMFCLSLQVGAATEAEWEACIERTEARLFAEGQCGASNCSDENNRSIATICRDEVGSPPHSDQEAEQLIKALNEGPSQVDIGNAKTYPDDSPVGRALAAYQARMKREIAEMHARNKIIEDWRFNQSGDFITIHGTTNRSGNLISAAVACDGKYVGNALGAIQGGGTFTMLLGDVPGTCRELSLSRISVQ